MFRTGIFLAACVLSMTAFGQSDKPSSNDQRVAPELLDELSTVPNATSAPSFAAITLEDLTRLAAKLKSTGDESTAEFLERYVREQEATAVKVSYVVPPRLTPTSLPISIEIEVFEVNAEDIPDAMLLETYPTPQKIKQIREELGRMVAANKATLAIRSQTVPSRFNQVTKFTEKRGEIELPGPEADSPPLATRFVGIEAQIMARLRSTGMLELQQAISSSHIDESNAITAYGKKVPGMTTTRLESTQETIAGQPILLGMPSRHIRHSLYVFTTVNPKPVADDLAPPAVEK